MKVSHGPKATAEMATVGIRPEVRVIQGEMDPRDLALLKQWIVLNRDVLIRYWDGDIAFTEEVFAALRPIA